MSFSTKAARTSVRVEEGAICSPNSFPFAYFRKTPNKRIFTSIIGNTPLIHEILKSWPLLVLIRIQAKSSDRWSPWDKLQFQCPRRRSYLLLAERPRHWNEREDAP